MSEAAPEGVPAPLPTPPTAASTRLADGEWHRLHPATPLLKGGIALIAILGVMIVNLRDVIINNVLGGGPGDEYDPFTYVIEHDYAGLIILAIIGGLILFIAGFYVSWRMHTFRVTDELVEVRSGILFRTNRRGRLDRIQGINIVRPFLARVFGAAKLEITVAGDDANVKLEYLASGAADELRREILSRAAGVQAEEAADAPAQAGGLIEKRVSELLAPELDPQSVAAQSVVQLHLGRLIGSLLLSGFTVFILLGIAATIVTVSLTGELFILFGFLPAIIGMAGFYVSRFTRSLRYSIASTPDGVRVGFGLLSTSNETLPPGRIHAVLVTQPLLWRPAGWWEVKINRASTSSAQGAAGQANTTILPVGNVDEVRRVLELVLPGVADVDLLVRGMVSPGGEDGFTNSPRRARVIRWFSQRRNGFAITPGAVLLRRGAIWRDLIVVPTARLQSIALSQGPLLRRLDLAAITVHTVAGPITPQLGALAAPDALAAFEQVTAAAIREAGADTSHRWRTTPPVDTTTPPVEPVETTPPVDTPTPTA